MSQLAPCQQDLPGHRLAQCEQSVARSGVTGLRARDQVIGISMISQTAAHRVERLGVTNERTQDAVRTVCVTVLAKEIPLPGTNEFPPAPVARRRSKAAHQYHRSSLASLSH